MRPSSHVLEGSTLSTQLAGRESRLSGLPVIKMWARKLQVAPVAAASRSKPRHSCGINDSDISPIPRLRKWLSMVQCRVSLQTTRQFLSFKGGGDMLHMYHGEVCCHQATEIVIAGGETVDAHALGHNGTKGSRQEATNTF
jgi:hypothetical protein